MVQPPPDLPIIDSLPGAGRALAPRLSAVLGTDRTRFATAGELQCYSGITPVLEAGGQQRCVHCRQPTPEPAVPSSAAQPRAALLCSYGGKPVQESSNSDLFRGCFLLTDYLRCLSAYSQ